MRAGVYQNTNGRYGITELEALGVLWALRHFRAYLMQSLTEAWRIAQDNIGQAQESQRRHASGSPGQDKKASSSISWPLSGFGSVFLLCDQLTDPMTHRESESEEGNTMSR